MAKYWKQIVISMIVVVSLIFAIILFAKNTINKYSVSTNRAMLQQVESTIDMKLFEINNIAIQMSFSKNLSMLRYADDLFSTDMVDITYEYERAMEDYSLFNQYIVTNFVMFFGSNYAVLPRSVQDLESFLEYFQNPQTGKSFTPDEMRAYIYEKNNVVGNRLKYFYNGKHTDVFPFIKWVGPKGKNGACIMVLIDAKKLTDLLASSVSTKKSLFAITDEKGGMILCNEKLSDGDKKLLKKNLEKRDFEEPMGSRRMFVSSSTFNNWRYVLISDNSEVHSNMNDLFMLIFVAGILFIAVVAVLLFLMIRRNKTLLMPIYRVVSSEDAKNINMKTGDFYNKFNKNINKLLDDKDYFEKTLKEQMPVVKETLFNNILKGELSSQSEIDASMRMFSFGMKGGWFCVAIVTFDSERLDGGVVNNYRNAFKQSLREFSADVAVCDINKTDIALIFNLQDSSGESRVYIGSMLKSLHELFQSKYNLRLLISVGGIYEGSGEISRSYGEAKSLQSREFMLRENDLMWHDENGEENDHYYYPPELETKLINAIKSGNCANTKDIIKNIFDINLKEKRISSDELTVFLHDFYGSILKAVSLKSENSELRRDIYKLFTTQYDGLGTLEFQQTFLDYVYRLCDSFGQHSGSPGEQQVLKIKQYVEDHYSDFDLGLTMVADEFGISNGYLSTLFKEYAGESFTDYLGKVRLRRARDLLTTTNQTVGAIAESVGYRSVNTFCRAFKRYFGVSAMEYKKNGS